jgi:accessory gene regulator B
MSYLKFSTKWAASLARIHNLDEVRQTELTYAIEVVTLNSANVILTLLLGWALNVFWETFISVLTIAAFRHSAGGGHSESPWRCAAVTITIFPLLALTASYAITWDAHLTGVLSMGAILAGFACIALYAPVDNHKAPIVSPVRRKKLKMIAFIIMAVISITITFLYFISWRIAHLIGMCLVFSTLWASFNLTPVGHHFWCFIDRIASSMEGGV